MGSRRVSTVFGFCLKQHPETPHPDTAHKHPCHDIGIPCDWSCLAGASSPGNSSPRRNFLNRHRILDFGVGSFASELVVIRDEPQADYIVPLTAFVTLPPSQVPALAFQTPWPVSHAVLLIPLQGIRTPPGSPSFPFENLYSRHCVEYTDVVQ